MKRLPVPRLPVRIALQFALRAEEPDNALNNNGVDLLLQAHF